MMRRIRNSLAHSRFGLVKNNNFDKEDYLWLEDIYRGDITMRGILSVKSLLKIAKIIESGYGNYNE